MLRLLRALFISGLVAVTLLGWGASPTAACTAGQPSLQWVLANAEYIVEAKVTAHQERFGPDHWELDVVRTFKGHVPDPLVLDSVHIGLCMDDLDGVTGRTVILAHGYRRVHGESIDAAWSFDDQDVLGNATVRGFHIRDQSLADVVAILEGELPDTDAAVRAIPPSGSTSYLAVVAAFLAAALSVWKLRPSKFSR